MHVVYRPDKLQKMQLKIMELSNLANTRFAELQIRGRMDEARVIEKDIYFLSGMRQMIDVMLETPTDLYKHLEGEIEAVENELLKTWKAQV